MASVDVLKLVVWRQKQCYSGLNHISYFMLYTQQQIAQYMYVLCMKNGYVPCGTLGEVF